MNNKDKLNESVLPLMKLNRVLKTLKFIERTQYEERQNQASRALFQRMIEQKHEHYEKKNQREEKLQRVKLQLGITSKKKQIRNSLVEFKQPPSEEEFNLDPQELAQNLEEFKEFLFGRKTNEIFSSPMKIYRRRSVASQGNEIEVIQNEPEPLIKEKQFIFEDEKERAMETLKRVRQFLHTKNSSKTTKNLFDKQTIQVKQVISDSIPDILKSQNVNRKKKSYRNFKQEKAPDHQEEIEKQKMKILEKMKGLGLNINQTAPFDVLQICKLMKNSQYSYQNTVVSQNQTQVSQYITQASNYKSNPQSKIQEVTDKLAKSSFYSQQATVPQTSSSPYRKQRRAYSIFTSQPKTPIPKRSDHYQQDLHGKLQEAQTQGDQMKVSLSRANKMIQKLQRSISQEYKDLLSQA